MTKEQFYSNIETFLQTKGSFIAITQGSNKLAKPNATINKYNFSLEDINTISGSVAAFIESLPSKGFTTGAQLIRRRTNGSTFKPLQSTELTFNELKTPEPQTEVQQPQIQLAAPLVQQPVAPQTASNMSTNGNISIPQHEYVSLKVKEERTEELRSRLHRAEKERDTAESELRIEKEKNHTLTRKLETIKDKHEIKIERVKSDQKGFLDTDTGKEVAVGLAGALPQILEALKPKAPAVGLAGAIGEMSMQKKQFINELKNIPDEYLQLLGTVVHHSMHTQGFIEELQQLIQSKNPHVANG